MAWGGNKIVVKRKIDEEGKKIEKYFWLWNNFWSGFGFGFFGFFGFGFSCLFLVCGLSWRFFLFSIFVTVLGAFLAYFSSYYFSSFSGWETRTLIIFSYIFFPGCEMTNGYFSTLEFSGYIFLILFNINFLFYFPGCEMTNWFFWGPGITFWVSFIFNIVFWSSIFSLRDFVDVQWNIKDLRWLRWLRWMRWGMDCNLRWLRWLQWTRWEYEMIKMTTMDEMRNGGNMRWLRWLRWMRGGMEFAPNSLSIFKTVASLEKKMQNCYFEIQSFILFNSILSHQFLHFRKLILKVYKLIPFYFSLCFQDRMSEWKEKG